MIRICKIKLEILFSNLVINIDCLLISEFGVSIVLENKKKVFLEIFILLLMN